MRCGREWEIGSELSSYCRSRRRNEIAAESMAIEGEQKRERNVGDDWKKARSPIAFGTCIKPRNA